MLTLLIILAPLLAYIVYEIANYRKKQLINKFKGPPSLPIVGNALNIGKTPHEIFYKLFEWWRQCDYENYRIWIGEFANLLISDVKDVEYILTSNEFIKKSDVYDMLHPWLGMGLLTSFGSKWHKHRKMITPAFHFKILQNFHEVMNTNSNKFIEKLRLASAGDSIFDLQDMVHYLTLDVICDTAMGVKINAMDNHDSEIVTAFKDMCTNINMRAFHPIKRKNSLYRFAPDYAEFKKVLKCLQDFTNDVIERRKATLNDSSNHKEAENDEYSKKKLAFLDTLLTATIDNRPLTQQEIYEEVSTFMFEGHDTTTSGITFAIYMLSRHPDVQARVYEEQKQILGGNLKRDATFQEITEMKYLDLFIKEAQRFYPSVPFIGRQTDKDYNMNGKIIPKGTSVSLFIIGLGYNEKNFPDPYRCNPDRFDTEKTGEKMNPFQYVPFSAGPRNCIGQKFALLELKTVVSKVVRYFEILPPLDELVSKDGYVEHFLGLPPEEELKFRPNRSKYDPILSAILTLKSDNGIAIRLRERN